MTLHRMQSVEALTAPYSSSTFLYMILYSGSSLPAWYWYFTDFCAGSLLSMEPRFAPTESVVSPSGSGFTHGMGNDVVEMVDVRGGAMKLGAATETGFQPAGKEYLEAGDAAGEWYLDKVVVVDGLFVGLVGMTPGLADVSSSGASDASAGVPAPSMAAIREVEDIVAVGAKSESKRDERCVDPEVSERSDDRHSQISGLSRRRNVQSRASATTSDSDVETIKI